MTSEQLPRHQNVLFAIETQDYYGKVATNALRPQTRLRQLVQRQDMWSWPQRWVREQDAATQPLKQMRLVRIDVQMSHLYLRARPGHPRFAFKDIRVAIFFSQRDRMVARLGYPGRENDLRGFIGEQAQPASQAENRIEHSAHGVRKWAIFHHCDRLCRRVSAAKKAHPIGFKLNAGDRFGRSRQYMHAPPGLVLRRAGPAARQERTVLCVVFSFNKQIAERWMRQIVGPGSQDNFRIAGQFDLTRTRRVIRY